ncbi:MAG TPA: PQQ-dependent sugar dehydrogenase [Pyrinomonadaceae bacterium]|nr:PQQ-dependent sugar dehydrogenase [Pyrinomonadaceae bacterium]
MLTTNQLKLGIIFLFIAIGIWFLFSDGLITNNVHARSSGPDAGFTNAPGELNCDDCHVNTTGPGTGALSILAPQVYVPGQTYQITVSHTNTDLTRKRWGFQLTALDDINQKAGSLEPLDALTQTLDNKGPFPNRQYIEHTSGGTFFGQGGGASWTFKWTAPPADAGPVMFYAAGNQANGDGNTSGDNIYYTFAASQPATGAPDYSIIVAPSSRLTVPGGSVTYNVTVTPSSGFTGQVALSVNSLPANVSGSFNQATVDITNSASQTSVLTVNANSGATLGTTPFIINATSNMLTRTASSSLTVASPTSADLSVTKTDSPDPATTGTNLTYRITVTNNGPAAATNVAINDALPTGVNFVSATSSQGTCSGTATINCAFGNLAVDASATVLIVVQPQSIGSISNTATVSASESDPLPANNTATATTTVEVPGTAPTMLVSDLRVRTVTSGLTLPTSIAFLAPNDFLVLEKDSGKVQRVVNGALQSTPLDLAVNNASERGLLGIALHPNFAANGYVYLYWTWRGAGDGANNLLGSDTSDITNVPLLGNRVDRFVWSNSTLTFDRNLINLRALQTDAGQPARGNHNGGVLRFGADGKLYVIVGDVGRRGLMQNVTSGGTVPDDSFGGPEPDDAHLTGVILRLNDDGTTPVDNPFFNVTTSLIGEAAANIKKIFAYGIRNSFGMAFDPLSNDLWTQENGDDSFDELNRVEAGFNGGWIQVIGPSSRIAEYKAIESALPPSSGLANGELQQIRWPASLIANTPAEALARLYVLPGSRYTEPEWSWKYAVAPSPIGFVRGRALGANYEGDLFVGASRTTLVGGYLFRFDLTSDRKRIAVAEARHEDRVADNQDKFDLTESESFLVGRDFGITTDIQTAPNGNLYVVSLSNGAVYEIYAPATVAFKSATYNVAENAGSATVIVSRSGDPSGAATVSYATSNGTASDKSDYTTTTGALHFDAGETEKTFNVLVADDAYVESGETVNLTLSNATGARLGAMSAAVLTITDNDTATSQNPVYDPRFFVRQHYVDFLNREPDAAGFNDWVRVLENCQPDQGGLASSPACDRVHVSSGFYRSPEFGERGYWIYRFYDAALGRLPLHAEFIPDMSRLSGFQTPIEQEVNKENFVSDFMARPEFAARYSALTTAAQAQAFVEKLEMTAGVKVAEPLRAQLISGMSSGQKTAAQTLRAFIESQQVWDRFFYRGFVAMQYFGYLRRDPETAGYNDWVDVLTNGRGQIGRGNYRHLIFGFIYSTEYRARFGQP